MVYYEGHGGSSVELALSLALTATLIFAPLTIASIGRRFWYVFLVWEGRRKACMHVCVCGGGGGTHGRPAGRAGCPRLCTCRNSCCIPESRLNYKFTNKRIVITNTSPLFKSEIQLPYSELREVRTAPRALGAWGDMVLFTKRGERLELIGMERYKELKDYIERCMYTL